MVSLSWCRRSTADALPIEEIIPVAVRVALKSREHFGERFIPNAQQVITDTALIAAKSNGGDKDAVVRVIENAFHACRRSINPLWDGSIA
jgi:hypothetical protein